MVRVKGNEIYRGSTPEISYYIDENIDLKSINNIWMSFKSFSTLITKEKEDLVIDAENKLISIKLSQEDTLSFRVGELYVQFRILMDDGTAIVLPIDNLVVKQILKNGGIE